MDPLTHGLLGAAIAQTALGSRPGRKTPWIGGLAAMAPDLDALISSATDPLLAVEYHRAFTHSLAFIPMGGAIAALPWLLLRAHRAQWRDLLAASILGYATHGLLDACTSFGTQLLWPFSSTRVGWDAIAIVDPIFTAALLIGVLLTARQNARRPVAAALLCCAAYLALGVAQRERALAAQARLAQARGHSLFKGEVFPTLGNQWVWRSLYQSGATLYLDRVRVPYLGRATHAPGTTAARVEHSDLPAELLTRPRISRDFARFHWFCSGYVARDPADATLFGDARYSQRDEVFVPVWGVRFHAQRDVPTEWVDRSRQRVVSVRELWRELSGADPRHRPVP